MIFDGRHVDEISDEEFEQLVVEKICESQHLEFKTAYAWQDETTRLELLLDVSSIANGGGGYVIVGIREDGDGCAQRFEDVNLGYSRS